MADYQVPYNLSPATGPTPTPAYNADIGVRRGGGTPDYRNAGQGGQGPTQGNQPSTPSGGGGWGSFGTYGAWSNAFQGVHGRTPNRQDEADYWDSQLFAEATGHGPSWDDWLTRYNTGSWNGQNTGRGAGAGYGGPYTDALLTAAEESDSLPDYIRGGFQAWINDVASNPNGAPSWLDSFAKGTAQQWGGTPATPGTPYENPPQAITPPKPAEQPTTAPAQPGQIPPPNLAGGSNQGWSWPQVAWNAVSGLFGGGQPQYPAVIQGGLSRLENAVPAGAGAQNPNRGWGAWAPAVTALSGLPWGLAGMMPGRRTGPMPAAGRGLAVEPTPMAPRGPAGGLSTLGAPPTGQGPSLGIGWRY